MHNECRYCDSPFGSETLDDGTKICRNCGAEWNPLLVESDDDDDEPFDADGLWLRVD